ncbi:AMP nucleosidase [Asticcacaulis endophyticus]|uniref:AMP nucleosidase n=1 Tax=Asticcacaulis endophyticus TaxID=1395890 RepID=A0A918UMF5_9CAUL|nr:AMP nucleosidase [Asticcacaulis endophyticus]GGZ20577.1 AMP nucleosidase [Asticcacaulis endophyticus]
MTLQNITTHATAHDAVTHLKTLYQTSVTQLQADLQAYLADKTKPNKVLRAEGRYCYPKLIVTWNGVDEDDDEDTPVLGHRHPFVNRAFARFSRPGVYAGSITRPDLYGDFIEEQIELMQKDYDITIEVGLSDQEIPYPYVLDGADLDLNSVSAVDLARFFPATELALIGNEVADGHEVRNADGSHPLSLFDGLRSDFSLARLKHYTGTPAEHTQGYILMTNYHRYVDVFVKYALEQLQDPDSPYTALSCCGNLLITRDTENPLELIANSPWRKHQMPAYHLLAPNRQGITLVNIGVGPSNAKTITDHLAVTRPQAWLMIGHCGGLRPSQSIGDYVLAHAYLRDDHVLDDVLPVEIPIPAIAEVQVALQQACVEVTGENPDQLKRRLRTGTVVTTDDRNWELRYSLSAIRFSQSRAVAIDMESATLAAQGYRFRVPYGTLLCVSDKPLHGELKLPGQANHFYERAISEHIDIGIKTMDILRDAGSRLHSRKLRAFDEPPFR